MSQFENSEVMLGYAKIMEDGLVKHAWTWRDIVTELGIDAAVNGVVAGAGALGYLGGGAAGGGLAGAGVALTVAGLPVWAAIAGGTALTMGLWYLTRQMDDNLPDLIDRLEALDPSGIYVQKVNGWIAELKRLEPMLVAPPTTTDRAQRGALNMQRKAAVDRCVAYMEQMWTEWPAVKASLTDMMFDPGQAEAAMKDTLVAIKKIQANLQATIGQAAEQDKKEVLRELKESSGVDYMTLASTIVNLHAETTKLSGKEPRFTTSNEKSAWALAKNLAGPKEKRGKVSPQDIQAAGPLMSDLKALMEQGLKVLKEKMAAPETKPEPVVAMSKPLLSKRAYSVSHGDEWISVTPGGQGVTSKTKGKGKRKQKGKGSPVVRGLQVVINKLNHALNGGAGIVDEDGVYGPVTADALSGVLSSDWRIANAVAKNAKVNKHTVKDVKLMRSRPALISAVYKVLSPIAERVEVSSGPGIAGRTWQREPGQQISQRDVEPRGTPGRGQTISIPPRREELLKYMKRYFYIVSGGEKWNVHQWLDMLGANESIMITWMNNFVDDVLGGSRVWDTGRTPVIFRDYIKDTYMEGREGGMRIF